jgi:hypothetical protein
MTENSKFLIGISVTIIGALLAWVPFIFEQCKNQTFEGKIISRYSNFSKDGKEIFFLYKISVVSRNKDYFLKDVDLKIKFINSNDLLVKSRNNRSTVFTFDTPKKLVLEGKDFLNNLSVLKKDDANVGYLFYVIPYDKDEKIISQEFIFNSTNNKSKLLKFQESEILEEQLLFDDSIWQDYLN